MLMSKFGRFFDFKTSNNKQQMKKTLLDMLDLTRLFKLP